MKSDKSNLKNGRSLKNSNLSEKALQSTEERYRSVLDDQTEVISRFRNDNILTFVNDAFCKFFGKTKADLIDKSWFPVAHPDDIKMIEKKLQTLSPDNPIVHIENRVYSGSGILYWMQFVNKGFFNERGMLIEIQSVGRDITERKNIEIALQESEERYRILFENSSEGILLTSTDGNVYSANPAACEMFGRTEEEICTLGRDAIVDHSDPRLKLALAERIQTGKFSGELNLVRKNGSIFPAEISSMVFTDSKGDMKSSMFIRDVTERKKSEEALKHSEALLREAQHMTRIGHWEIDDIYGTPRWSKEIFHIFGLDSSKGEPSFEEHQNFILTADWHILHDAINRAFSEGLAFDVEFRFLLPGYNIRWINAKGEVNRDGDGHIIGIFGTIQDISERKYAQELMRQSEELFRKIFEEGPLGMAVVDLDFKFLRVNSAACSMVGYREEELLSLSFVDITFPKDIDKDLELTKKLINGEIPFYHIEKRYIKKNGDFIWINLSKSIFRSESGNPLYFLAMMEDIMLRKLAEESLQVAHTYNRRLIESSVDPFVTIGPDGKITDVNKATEDATGFSREHLIGTDFSNYFTDPENAKAGYRKVFNDGFVRDYALELRHRDGHIIYVVYNASLYKDKDDNVIGIFAAARDITARKRAEAELEIHRSQLEEIVKERTLDLMLVNKRLEDEISERKMINDSLVQSKIILDSIADGVFTVEDKSIINSFNEAAETITGFSKKDAIGNIHSHIFKIVETNFYLDHEFENNHEIIDQSMHIYNNAGKIIPVSISTSILNDSSGEKSGFACVFRDLSKLEKLRKTLEKEYTFLDMISKNSEMQKIFNILPDVASSDSTVLIEGPTGTGKDLLARSIHSLSGRKDKTICIVNCGTLPPQLMESELFGYMKGSFTDAKTDKKGKIYIAEGGTLFFDEIGDLPFNLQVKLLRLLENHEYEPVGSTKPIKANIRVLAATNKNLLELVKFGKFRDDLYFRLDIVKFYLPALSKRKEDIPYLIDYFIEKFNIQKDKKIFRVSDDVLQILLNHNYPGNIRELENIIEYAFIVCKGSKIEVEHLPNEINSKSIFFEINDIEREKIINALDKCNGNKTEACKELKTSYATLFRKLKKYNIQK